MNTLTLQDLKDLLAIQAEDWERTKLAKIDALRAKQADIAQSMATVTNPADISTKIAELTAVENEIKQINIGGVPTLETVLRSSKKFIQYEGEYYELPSNTGTVRTTGVKRSAPFTAGERVICRFGGMVSPVYVVLESGDLLDETTKQIWKPSHAVTRMYAEAEGLTFQEYWDLRNSGNNKFSGHAGYSLGNWKAWQKYE